MTRSLGFRTDVALRRTDGAEVETQPEATAVRMRANAGFRWGNFLLVAEAGDPVERAGRHAAAFPGAGFVTVGVDDAHAELDEGAWLGAGFEIERLAVLEADRAPAAAVSGVRPLTTGDDWAAELSIALELEPGADAAHLEFAHLRSSERRRAVAAGGLLWLGVEQDGEIVATAGVGDAGDGIARFQDVQTREAHRRRGHASVLVAAGVAAAARGFGSTRFVLVAEREGPAIDLYRRLGFHQTETQLQLARVDPA